MLADLPSGAARPVKPVGYSGSDVEGAEPSAPRNQNDLAALANAEIAKAKAEGRVLKFGDVFAKLAAQHPAAAKALFTGGEANHA
jgi:hypothetical protein